MNDNIDYSNNNLQLASFGSRIQAYIIDDILISIVFIALYWDLFSQAKDTEEMMIILHNTIYQVMFLKFIYQSFFIWYYGATIGKIIAKIRVIDYHNFGRITLFSSIVRAFFRILSEMFFYIGFLFAFVGDSKQTLQDRVAKTLVVNA